MFSSNHWTYKSNFKNPREKYKFISKHSLLVFAHSTLGYEFLARGFKCACFNHSFLKKNRKYFKTFTHTGPFWSKPNSYSSVELTLKKVLSYSKKKWKKIYKKYSYEILYYNKGNQLKKNLIKELLNR